MKNKTFKFLSIFFFIFLFSFNTNALAISSDTNCDSNSTNCTMIVSPSSSGNSFIGKIGDFFKSIFGIKDKVVTPIVTTPTPINTPTPQVVNTPTTIIQQISQAGLTGNTGLQGFRGFTGPQGPKGDKGEPGSSIDSSSFVSKSFLIGQVDRIYDSTSNSIQGLSDSLSKEINTKLLTVTGDATISGGLTVTGNITGNVVGTINPSFTLGSIPFQGASGLTQDNANLFWDNVNHRLGLGTITPTEKLNVIGNGLFSGILTASSLNVTDAVTTRANLGLTYATNINISNNDNNIITAWGDSLTSASGGGIRFTDQLAKLLNSSFYVYNEGVGGNTSKQIAVRQGGVQTTATIVGGFIPVSGGVTVTFPSGYEPVTSYGPSGGIKSTISGIYGVITYDGSTYTFTRSNSGSTVAASGSVPVTIDTNHLNDGGVIIWAGRNNFTSPTQVKSDIAAMVSSLGHTRYIILGVTNASNEQSGSANYNTIIQLNNDLASLYGSHFIDIRSYIVSQYNSDIPQDVTDHNNDVMPSSLRSDTVHLNTAGYLLVAQMVYQNISLLQPSSVVSSILTTKNIPYIFANSPIINSPQISIGTTFSPALLSEQSTPLLESAAMGTEIINGTGWTSTGWTGSYNSFTHTTGNTTALSRTMANTIGNIYQISFTITGRTAGTFTVGLGGETSNKTFSATDSYAPKTLSTNGNLIFTPTTDFNGTISNISVKQITGIYIPSYSLLDSTGISMLEIRSSLSTLGNQFIGKYAGKYNTTGYNNTANGFQSLQNNTSGYNNTAIGLNSLFSNTTGYSNNANGINSLQNNTTGYQNTANGVYSLQNNTSGYNNVASGMSSLQLNTTGYQNTASGFQSLQNNTTGNNNTANGIDSLQYNTTGVNNTANGYYALSSNLTGSNNIAEGYRSLRYSGSTVTAGSFIVGVSYTIISTGNTDFTLVGASNSSVGTVFTATGVGSGTGVASSNTSNNTALGYQAGSYLGNGTTQNNASYNSLYLGFQTYSLANGDQNEIVIGYNAIGSGSNTIKLGNNAITGLYLDGNLAKIIGMDRHTTANTAGNGLTLKSGGATLLATDKNGGDLTLSSGIATGTGSSNIHFFTGTASTTGTADNTTTEKMTILGNGNVGVGVTPAYKLHIFENRADYAAAVINDGNVADRSGLLIQAGLDDNTVAGPSTLIGFKDGDATSIGSITFGSNSVAYNTTSDERLKTLVNDQTLSSLNVLNQIAIHDFTWNNDTSKDIYQGVFAQELYNIYPHAVTKPIKDSDNWMVDYSKLTPLLVKSIQEMDLKITDISNLATENTWRDSLIAWFGNATNGIAKIFVGEVDSNKVKTDTLCIGSTCVTESQLQTLLQNSSISNTGEDTDNTENNTDVCSNIDGVQIEIPAGDEINAEGQCVVITGGDTGGTDVCPNIDGVQTEIPAGDEINVDGQCLEIIIPDIIVPPIATSEIII